MTRTASLAGTAWAFAPGGDRTPTAIGETTGGIDGNAISPQVDWGDATGRYVGGVDADGRASGVTTWMAGPLECIEPSS